MKIILLSGGSGTRLWPLSNESRSKQFLKVISNPDNELESMVQRIWRQLDVTGLLEDAYVSTNKKQVDILQNQLGFQVPLIIEPERRDTFPAISLVASYLYSMKKVDPLDVIIVMPVDSYVENKFFDKIKELEKATQQLEMDIALIGVNPSSASTKYGYIIPERENVLDCNKTETTMRVFEFKEKPTEMEAHRLLEQNALWNCGVFAFRLGYIIEQLEKRGLPTQFTEAVQHYERFPKISFDYEIVEKAERIAVIPYDGDWEDLGTWDALTQKMDMSVIGKATKSDDCINTHVINELDIPIILSGISNALIAASPDGILVSDKEKSYQMKEIVNSLNQRPMFEERRWGWYRVLDYKESDDGAKTLTKRLCLLAEKNISYQYHHHRSEVWIIVKGEGEFVLNDEVQFVKQGDVLTISIGAKHGIKAITELEIIEVQMGRKLVEDDIVRLFLSWEEMMESIGKGF